MDQRLSSEKERLRDTDWKEWGPYLSDRQWGTVREDYSADGQAWTYTTHDMAAGKAWRWGEEGIGGFADKRQRELAMVRCIGGTRRQLAVTQRLYGGLDLDLRAVSVGGSSQLCGQPGLTVQREHLFHFELIHHNSVDRQA